MVIGQRRGRLWLPDEEGPVALDEMVIVGERLESLPLNGRHEETFPTPAEIFDRSLGLTGKGALSRLSKMRVAVVGASGTGSLMMELLLRAGAGRNRGL